MRWRGRGVLGEKGEKVLLGALLGLRGCGRLLAALADGTGRARG